jgi:hypothetical protein
MNSDDDGLWLRSPASSGGCRLFFIIIIIAPLTPKYQLTIPSKNTRKSQTIYKINRGSTVKTSSESVGELAGS